MVAPATSSVVIECPKCGTRYQLPEEAFGTKGRRVSCAHCGETWLAKPERVPLPDPDVLFDAVAEQKLDDVFEAEEKAGAVATVTDDPEEEERLRTLAEIKAAIAPKSPRLPESIPDPAGDRKRQKAFDKRQAALFRQLPLAKVRRIARIASVSVLAVVIVCAIAFRTEIVRQFPDLAGVYEALGLGVNVVGLEFRDVNTMVTVRGGATVMQVDGRIFSVAPRAMVVPPVIVALLDSEGKAVYEWSVVPVVGDLEPGEVVDFSTQLSSPPEGATRVRLRFSDGRARAAETSVPAATTSSN
jgi:predicted Zn finger-like uncharacterized protein